MGNYGEMVQILTVICYRNLYLVLYRSNRFNFIIKFHQMIFSYFINDNGIMHYFHMIKGRYILYNVQIFLI